MGNQHLGDSCQLQEVCAAEAAGSPSNQVLGGESVSRPAGNSGSEEGLQFHRCKPLATPIRLARSN